MTTPWPQHDFQPSECPLGSVRTPGYYTAGEGSLNPREPGCCQEGRARERTQPADSQGPTEGLGTPGPPCGEVAREECTRTKSSCLSRTLALVPATFSPRPRRSGLDLPFIHRSEGGGCVLHRAQPSVHAWTRARAAPGCAPLPPPPPSPGKDELSMDSGKGQLVGRMEKQL